MNMVICGENCIYQTDGRCRLKAENAVLSPTPKNGCGYYLPSGGMQKKRSAADNAAAKKSAEYFR